MKGVRKGYLCSGEINTEWQEMRDDGMTAVQIAEIVHKNPMTIRRHTKEPTTDIYKPGVVDQVCRMRNNCETVTSISQRLHISYSSVQRCIKLGIARGLTPAICPHYSMWKPTKDEIPAVLSDADDCRTRELRGLTQAEYERLLIVNREHDEGRFSGDKYGGYHHKHSREADG